MDLLKRGEAPWLQKLRRFFVSPWCMAVLFALAAVVTMLRIEIIGLIIFLVLICAQLVLCNNILAPIAPALLTCLFMIRSSEIKGFVKQSDKLLNMFLPYWWLVFLPIAALIIHAVLYHKPVVWGKSAWAIFGVSCAVTLGGLGSISLKEYTTGASLYHMAALGFGMLLAYLWMSSAIPLDEDGSLEEYIPNVMLLLGLFACFMILNKYLNNIPKLMRKPQLLAFQWRNNVSTFLMLALPFPFFKAFKKPPYVLAGLAMYLALLLSGSRGGMLFGTIELIMCILFALFADKKRRLVYVGIIIALLAALVVGLTLLLPFFLPVITRLLESVFNGDEEVRVLLYRRAVEDFLSNPLFGVGIGYMGNRDIHPSKDFALCWYHCAPLQIIGSMGLVGAAAYLYQYIVRIRIFLRGRATKFRLTLFLAWVGVEMMSLVNPGVFAPIPYLLIVTLFVVVAEKSR